MIGPAIPDGEEQRLFALSQVATIDASLVAALDEITQRIATICQTPTAIVNFVGERRTYCPSATGISLCFADRSTSFCAYAIDEPDRLFVVRDARTDVRFLDNPLVTGEPFIRFYAGAAIVTAAGSVLGMLCVIDRVARTISTRQSLALIAEAKLVGELLERYDDAPVVARDDGIGQVVAISSPAPIRVAPQPDAATSNQPIVQSGELTATIIDCIPGVFYLCNTHARIVLWNRRLEDVTGYSGEEIAAMDAYELLIERDRPHASEAIARCFRAGSATSDVAFATKDGRSIPYSFNGRTIVYGGERCLLAVGVDVSERTLVQNKLKFAALHDPLTGLGNRTMLSDRLQHSIAGASRDASAIVAVYFLDIDRFKLVNDSLGHHAGDELLVAVAQRLRQQLRLEDTIVRLGGDEFVIVADAHRNDDVIALAGRIMASFTEPFAVAGVSLKITTSLGISTYPNDGLDADELLRNADSAMYFAKDRGRDNFHVFAPAMHAAAVNRFTIEAEMRAGLENGEFELYYQPVVDLVTGAFLSAEALVRWNHPTRGLMMPGTFIGIAEETGLIVRLGAWVLREGAKRARQLTDAGFTDAYISVNVSGRQLRDREFFDVVRSAIAEFDLREGSLGIEITETAALGDPDRALVTLDACSAAGLVILLDDFGTHYSSLVYLRKFPIDVIKIDKGFIDGLATEPEDRSIVSAIVALGASLGCDVLAEGIEDGAQATWLVEQGCTHGTGYHFARPMPAASFEAWLAAAHAATNAIAATG